jgi:hypothetical protein
VSPSLSNCSERDTPELNPPIPFTLGDFSREQYERADSEHGRAALLTYANVLESIEKMKDGTGLKFELSLAYTRLAVLEDNAGNSAQSHAYMTKARYWNLANGGRDHSDSEMKAVLPRFDAL